MKRRILCSELTEAAYPGNIGFEEMVKFYKIANKKQLEEMIKIIDKSDWLKFKTLIEDVISEKLQ